MPEKNLGREGKVGEWAIYHFYPPYPTGYAKIIGVLDRAYELDTLHPLQFWDKRFCATFETETEAKKEYEDFRNNKNNYAYEG